VGFVVDKVALAQAVLRVLRFSRLSIVPPLPRCSYQKDKRAKPGNLQNKNSLSEIGQHWTESTFTWSFKGRVMARAAGRRSRSEVSPLVVDIA
jgi:hypothetical protein